MNWRKCLKHSFENESQSEENDQREISIKRATNPEVKKLLTFYWTIWSNEVLWTWSKFPTCAEYVSRFKKMKLWRILSQTKLTDFFKRNFSISWFSVQSLSFENHWNWKCCKRSYKVEINQHVTQCMYVQR